MALQWKWDEKVGEIEFLDHDKLSKCNLYQGNAFLIMIYEYKEDNKNMYNVLSFFADETHAKRMFGIDKKYKNTYGDNLFNKLDFKMTKIKLDKDKYAYVDKLVRMILKAFDNITIEIYTDGKEN